LVPKTRLINTDTLGAPLERTEPPRTTLAACTLEEAAAVLERIRSDYVSTQVFFELGREAPVGMLNQGQLFRVSLPSIARHCRVRNFEHLTTCLETITGAFREVRRDPEASLFALDQRGGLYVHEVIHHNIAKLWHQLVLGEAGQAAIQPGRPMQPAPARSPVA
jgi:hypothetical protein